MDCPRAHIELFAGLASSNGGISGASYRVKDGAAPLRGAHGDSVTSVKLSYFRTGRIAI